MKYKEQITSCALTKKMKKKILIVEDDQIIAGTLQEFLSAEGFETLLALDGETGLGLAKKESPDLIILDIILPKKDGYEIIKEIRNDQNSKSTPIVLLTNLGNPSNIGKALKLGATTYLTKTDYSLKEVVEKVKEVLKIKE